VEYVVERLADDKEWRILFAGILIGSGLSGLVGFFLQALNEYADPDESTWFPD
jgi:hypothetical protein